MPITLSEALQAVIDNIDPVGRLTELVGKTAREIMSIKDIHKKRRALTKLRGLVGVMSGVNAIKITAGEVLDHYIQRPSPGGWRDVRNYLDMIADKPRSVRAEVAALAEEIADVTSLDLTQSLTAALIRQSEFYSKLAQTEEPKTPADMETLKETAAKLNALLSKVLDLERDLAQSIKDAR